jgi:hypothetical protein
MDSAPSAINWLLKQLHIDSLGALFLFELLITGIVPPAIRLLFRRFSWLSFVIGLFAILIIHVLWDLEIEKNAQQMHQGAVGLAVVFIVIPSAAVCLLGWFVSSAVMAFLASPPPTYPSTPTEH